MVRFSQIVCSVHTFNSSSIRSQFQELQAQCVYVTPVPELQTKTNTCAEVISQVQRSPSALPNRTVMYALHGQHSHHKRLGEGCA
ncbi:hypothetical protein XENTR_v10002074 [Xenopus tropicalis]|nr:hypothetical protein XENTR_v10002074 [Xenopus tropicalis]